MRLLSNSAPVNRDSFDTVQPIGTVDTVPFWNGSFFDYAPFVLAIAATLTIWIRDPFVEWAYEFAVLGIAAAACLRRQVFIWTPQTCALAAIACWGFGQLLLGATVYRYATWNAALRYGALAATAYLASSARRIGFFLPALAWVGFLLSAVSVLAYYASPQRVLWIFPIENPAAWGPFLNRDNFAQFLELTVPVTLWLAITRDHMYLYLASAMLAAGIASASRAGAVLLLVECAAFFLISRRTRVLARFFAAALVLTAIAGAGELVSRLRDPDPLRYRREMDRSAIAMIRARPFTGFGIGTFSTVYPQFAEFDAGLIVDHAHNDWLEWTAEGGVGYLAAWVLLAASLLHKLRRQLWILGVLAVMAHAAVDYPFARFGISAWTFLLIGMREVGPTAH